MRYKKPVTPGQRGMILTDNNFFYFKKISHLLCFKKKSSGRNNHGRITVRHRGGGAKRMYRKVDFYRNKFYVRCVIKSIEYDPNRSSNIMLVLYEDGEYRYHIHIDNLKVGDVILSGSEIPNINGNHKPIKDIPIGFKICCLELIPGKGSKLFRSSGMFCKLVSIKDNFCVVRNKGNELEINSMCFATIGRVGNCDHYLVKIGKAGSKRNMGIRPTVRGVAMNPVDHPHGGGEGKTSSKRHPVSFSGVLTKGFKTKSKNV